MKQFSVQQEAKGNTVCLSNFPALDIQLFFYFHNFLNSHESIDPSQGYLLQSRTCTNEIPGFHQRSDRELDRERRLRYLEQRSHQGFLENPPILRSNSIELTYEVIVQ